MKRYDSRQKTQNVPVCTDLYSFVQNCFRTKIGGEVSQCDMVFLKLDSAGYHLENINLFFLFPFPYSVNET